MCCSVLSSQNVLLKTAMAISGAVIFLSLARIKNLPYIPRLPISHNSSSSSLRPCLSSEKIKGKKKNKNNKKKRVKFADDVEVKKSETIYASMKKDEVFISKKVSKVRGIMPGNRSALYHGILRDRVRRFQNC